MVELVTPDPSRINSAASPCDGCGKMMPADEPYITGIESCCGGGCVRAICLACARRAGELAGLLRVEVVGMVHPAPGDVIFCRTAEDFPDQYRAAACLELRRAFPNNTVAVIPHGAEIVTDANTTTLPDARSEPRPVPDALRWHEPVRGLVDALAESDADKPSVVEGQP